MTLNIWRYAHLALAITASVFLTLASITGIILAANAVQEKMPAYRVHDFNSISLAESLPALRKTFTDISEISVDENQFVTLQGTDGNGNDVNAYIDPRTGKILGKPQKQSAFIQWVTSFHRSLFLHETGRFFIGLTAFLLLLITISGIALVIQRQRGLQRFFAKIVKDYFAQYYHVITGRLMLIPVLLIALSGTYLSMSRFGIFPEQKINHHIKTDDNAAPPEAKNIADFSVFKNTKLAQVEKIEFPFAEDPEEHYMLKLKDREIIVNQFNGEVLSEVRYSATTLLTNLSLNVHTGRTNAVWAIVLAIATLNILFFIYSGFAITLRRRATRIKNKYKATESKIILLVGSENGSTLGFANAVHQQLLANGQASHLTQMNNYSVFPKAEHIIVFTSTHGLGNAPSNADKFVSLVQQYPQTNSVNVSVVGFGLYAYPDFCAYAFGVEKLLAAQNWSVPFLPIHTINDKSAEQFSAWVKAWGEKAQLPLIASPALFAAKPSSLQSFIVVEKTEVANEDNIFSVRLRPRGRTKFSSGDLLAIYPDENKERFYSIGKINNDIQLVVKLQAFGLGTNYLHNLEHGQIIKARIVRNNSFHFPKKKSVAMIANGTGIAPFIGMIDENIQKAEIRLYCGFRNKTSLNEQHRKIIDDNIQKQKLKAFYVAYSKENTKQYVTDLIVNDAAYFAQLLTNGGIVMICGSIAMQNDVLKILERIAAEHTDKNFNFYKSRGQVLSDCY